MYMYSGRAHGGRLLVEWRSWERSLHVQAELHRAPAPQPEAARAAAGAAPVAQSEQTAVTCGAPLHRSTCFLHRTYNRRRCVAGLPAETNDLCEGSRTPGSIPYLSGRARGSSDVAWELRRIAPELRGAQSGEQDAHDERAPPRVGREREQDQ